LKIGDHRLRLLREADPARLPWKSLNVNVVFECTGAFARREDLEAHIRAGAGYVILSAPARGRRGRNYRPRCEYAAAEFRHHFVCELHHELHYAGDGDSWAADGREEGDHDHRSREHRQPGDCRHGAQPESDRYRGTLGVTSDRVAVADRRGGDGWRRFACRYSFSATALLCSSSCEL
jgi:hypothetical protein